MGYGVIWSLLVVSLVTPTSCKHGKCEDGGSSSIRDQVTMPVRTAVPATIRMGPAKCVEHRRHDLRSARYGSRGRCRSEALWWSSGYRRCEIPAPKRPEREYLHLREHHVRIRAFSGRDQCRGRYSVHVRRYHRRCVRSMPREEHRPDRTALNLDRSPRGQRSFSAPTGPSTWGCGPRSRPG